MKPEVLVDITGSDHLELRWGDRFRGWYETKTFLRTESLVLGGGLSYRLKVFDYNFRFIMPAKLEFSEGMIAYSEAERLLGVFRFPQKENGRFSAPYSFGQTQDQLNVLSDEDIRSLVRNRKVLTFEAFRIPQFGFEYFYLTEGEYQELSELVGEEEIKNFKSRVAKDLDARYEEIRTKILGLPHILLIVRNVLDFRLRDMKEVSLMTDGILWA